MTNLITNYDVFYNKLNDFSDKEVRIYTSTNEINDDLNNKILLIDNKNIYIGILEYLLILGDIALFEEILKILLQTKKYSEYNKLMDNFIIKAADQKDLIVNTQIMLMVEYLFDNNFNDKGVELFKLILKENKPEIMVYKSYRNEESVFDVFMLASSRFYNFYSYKKVILEITNDLVEKLKLNENQDINDIKQNIINFTDAYNREIKEEVCNIFLNKLFKNNTEKLKKVLLSEDNAEINEVINNYDAKTRENEKIFIDKFVEKIQPQMIEEIVEGDSEPQVKVSFVKKLLKYLIHSKDEELEDIIHYINLNQAEKKLEPERVFGLSRPEFEKEYPEIHKNWNMNIFSKNNPFHMKRNLEKFETKIKNTKSSKDKKKTITRKTLTPMNKRNTLTRTRKIKTL
jgi:hypothetical protein